MGKKGRIPDPLAEARDLYEAALDMHNQRRWDESIDACRKSLELRQGDLAAENLITRVQGYKETPPFDAWQGEFVRTTKD